MLSQRRRVREEEEVEQRAVYNLGCGEQQETWVLSLRRRVKKARRRFWYNCHSHTRTGHMALDSEMMARFAQSAAALSGW